MKPKIIPAPGAEPVAPEIIEKSILDLAEGVRKLTASRLRQETIITLLHDHSKVGKREIRYILNTLGDLENIFLKPAKK